MIVNCVRRTSPSFISISAKGMIRQHSVGSKVVFDHELKRRQRNDAASRSNALDFDYLRSEVASRLVDRLEDIQREFPIMLDIGCHSGAHVYNAIVAQEGLGGKGGIGGVETVIQGDNAETCARKAIEVLAVHLRDVNSLLMYISE
jgi:hypothetical protein